MDRKIKSLEKQKSFAFYKYYEECKRNHKEYMNLYNYHKKTYEELIQFTELPTHIINELKEKYTKEKQEISCPICLDVIQMDNLTFSSCCCKYCKNCYDKLLEQPIENRNCSLCRKKLYVKKK